MAGVKTFVPAVAIDGTEATGTITIIDYEALALAAVVVTVAGSASTQGVDWVAEVSNTATATGLAGVLDDIEGVEATPLAEVITVEAASDGAAGNSITLASSDEVNLTLSGTHLTGGADAVAAVNSILVGDGPQSIEGISVMAGADTCVANLYDGTTSDGTLVASLSCTASVSNTFKFTKGIVFKTGCFLDLVLADPEAPPSLVTITYTKI